MNYFIYRAASLKHQDLMTYDSCENCLGANLERIARMREVATR